MFIILDKVKMALCIVKVSTIFVCQIKCPVALIFYSGSDKCDTSECKVNIMPISKKRAVAVGGMWHHIIKK